MSQSDIHYAQIRGKKEGLLLSLIPLTAWVQMQVLRMPI